MTTHSNNHIFVDLDETLIYTGTNRGIKKDGKEIIKQVMLSDDDVYTAQLRPNAIVFLNELRKLSSNVFMLTIATKEYAVIMNRIFGLGFFSSMIYSREHIQALDVPTLSCGNVFLFDNLTKAGNRNKVIFLRTLGELDYIQVPAYYGGPEHHNGFTPELIEKLILPIKNKIKT
jgi:hypothetical protein